MEPAADNRVLSKPEIGSTVVPLASSNRCDYYPGLVKPISKKIDSVGLKRRLGLLYGVAIVVGLSIGGGIYITPNVVLRYAGSPGLTLIIWVIGGINSILGGLVYVEIGINIPFAGEGYPYLCELYNPFFGFMYVWQHLLVVRPGSNALKLIIFGRYLLKPLFQHCEIPIVAIKLLATFMAIMITVLNCRNVKFIARGQSFLSGLAVVVLLTLSAIGIYFLVTGRLENLQDPFKDSKTGPGNLAVALYATLFCYSGWSALNFVIEELENPNRTLPLAIAISSTLLTLLFTLVNLTYLLVLDKQEALTSEAIAISTVMKISANSGWIMSILIALNACSTTNSGQLVASRLAFAAARNKHLPSALSFISISQATPVISVIFVGVVTLIFIWSFNVELILTNVIFSGLMGGFFVSIGYIRRRLKSTAVPSNTFKVPLAIHVIHAASLFLFLLVPLVTNPTKAAVGFLLVLVSSLAYYLLFVQWRFISRYKRIETINSFIQKLFDCAPEEKHQ